MNTWTDHISINNKADTTATGKITVHIPTHVHHRLQDKTGMAGMADGDNRHYGCQDNFAGKIHRYNGWHQYSFLSISFMPIQRLFESHWLSPGLLLYRQYGMICGRWPCMVHCECWSSIFDRIRFHPWIRLFDSRFLIVWYFSLLIAASQVSLFLCHSVQSYIYLVYSILKKHAAVQRKFVSVCFLFLLFWGTPLKVTLKGRNSPWLPWTINTVGQQALFL